MQIVPPAAKAFFHGRSNNGNPSINGIMRIIPYDTVTADPQGLLYLGLNTTDLKIKNYGFYRFTGNTTLNVLTAGGNGQLAIQNVTRSLIASSFGVMVSNDVCEVLTTDVTWECFPGDIIQMSVTNWAGTARLLQAAIPSVATTLTVMQVA